MLLNGHCFIFVAKINAKTKDEMYILRFQPYLFSSTVLPQKAMSEKDFPRRHIRSVPDCWFSVPVTNFSQSGKAVNY